METASAHKLWPSVVWEDMRERMLMKQAMELKATFNISCEQPGFTIIFTCHKKYVSKHFTIYIMIK